MSQSASVNNCDGIALPYIAGAPIPNAIGAEIGVVSQHSRTKQIQRTGVGFYIRADHMANSEIDYSGI
jgi:hypothetical protein